VAMLNPVSAHTSILDVKLSTIVHQEFSEMHALLQSGKKNRCYQYSTNKVLFTENSKPKGVFFLKSGNVKLSRQDENGRNIDIETVTDGCYLGISAVVRNKMYANTAVTCCDCIIDFISRNEFLKLLEQYPVFSHKILVDLCHFLGQPLNGNTVSQKDATKRRLAEALLFLSQHDVNQPDNAKKNISLRELSRITGIEKNIIEGYINAFQINNYLRRKNDTITLFDIQALKKMTY
jgi:CRP-like cAMP-binding protein